MKHIKTLKTWATLFALALVCVVFMNTEKASAAETYEEVSGIAKQITWKYDAGLDAFVIERNGSTAITTSDAIGLYFSAGKEISKWSASKNLFKLDIEEIINDKDTDGVSGQAIKLSSDSLKKIGTTKKSFFAIAATHGSIDCETMITVNASEWKKPTIIIDYNAAREGNTEIALASVTYKASEGKSSVTEAFGQVTDLLTSENGGNTNKKAFDTLEWSTDSATWYNVYDKDNGFTGERLANLIVSAAATKINVFFRQSGVSSKGTTIPNESSFRPSDATKVAIKSAGKAPSVKLDVKKLPTISVKHKLDYQVVVTGAPVDASGKAIAFESIKAENIKDTPDPDDWITVLTYNRDGSAKYPYMPTNEFKTVKMSKDAGEDITKFYTDDETVKKNLPLEKLLYNTGNLWKKDENDVRYNTTLDYIDLTKDNQFYVVFVRKSAAPGKPATGYGTIWFEGMPDEPKTEIKAKSGEYVAFDIPSGSGQYQSTVVSAKDFNPASPSASQIDWTSVSWKNTNGSTMFKAGLKVSNYKTFVNGTANKSANASQVAAVGDYILVRSAGDKNKNTLPSEYSVYTIKANDKTSKLITIEAQSFTEAEKSLAVEVKVGDAVVASGDAINCDVDLGKAITSKKVTLQYTVQKAKPEVVKSSDLKNVTYKYYKGVVSGDAIVKGAETTAIAVDAKAAAVTATANGCYVIEINYTYNGEKLDPVSIVLNVTGVMTVEVTAGGEDVATPSGIGYAADLKEVTSGAIKAKLYLNGAEKKAADIEFKYVSADTAKVEVSTTGAVTVKDTCEDVAVTVTASWKETVDKKEVTKTSEVVIKISGQGEPK